MTPEIVLLHGAGGHPVTRSPIQILLKCKGYQCHNIKYDHSGNLQSCIDSVNIMLNKYIKNTLKLL